MTYRKFKADYLFLGDRMAEPDSVLITTAEGVVQGVVSGADAGEGAAVLSGLLCPGFVNCHCHLELSHMRGVIPEGTGLVDFLIAVMRRRGIAGNEAGSRGGKGKEAGSGEEEGKETVREAIARGEREMLEGGIVAVGDICNSTDTLDTKRHGRLGYRNFIETMGFMEGAAAGRFEASRQVFDRFEAVAPGMNSIVPHAPYSVSAALFRLVAGFAAEGAAKGRMLSIHNQESDAENEFCLSGSGEFLRLYRELGLDVSFFHGTGKRSLESVMEFVGSDQPIILVHNVATEREDLRRAGTGSNRFFCLCPNANLYIGGVLPDVEMLLKEGCRLVIGTDSLASNRSLSMLSELKTLAKAFPGLDTPTLLRWATAEGAAALQMQDRFGGFVRGRKPGVVWLRGLEGGRITTATTVERLI
jgi:aminodeoxyfutalosine deaminase